MLAILTTQLFTLTGEHKLKPIKYIVIIFILLVSASFIVAPFIEKIDLNLPISIAILGLLLILTTFIIFRKTVLSGKSKLVALTLITTVVLLITSSHVFSNNELKVNATKPITDFIKQQKLSDRNILVYNTRKSSIAFGLNKSIISLNNGHESLARETQFETSENWKKYLVDLKNDDEVNYLKQLLEQPTVLISNKKLASNTEWILKHYKNKKVMGKWTIYY
jgi:4-amino-4-deoxy-L-arabinose transferase